MGTPFALFTPDYMQTSFGNLTSLFRNGPFSGVSVYYGRIFLGLGVTNGKSQLAVVVKRGFRSLSGPAWHDTLRMF